MSSCPTVEDSPTNRGTTDLYQTIHRVIGLPELLSIIFSSLKQADLARAARVCQLWSSLALDQLWEETPDIDHLINVYSRLKRDQYGLLQFEDVSGGGHWDKFWSYACRVRAVSRCGKKYGPDVIPHLLHKVKTSDSGKTFLPNLRNISFRTWSCDAQALSIFSLIPSGLEALSIDCYYASSLSESAVLKLNQALAESSVERLKILKLSSLLPASEALRRTCTNILHQQKFLKCLNLSPLALTTKELQNIGNLPHLTELHLHHRGGSVQELQEAFATIGKQFPNLRSASLVDAMQVRADIMVMEGLASCHELRAVTLSCSLPQPVTAEAIRTLARYWPNLEDLGFVTIHPPSNIVGAPLALLEDVALAWPETLLALSLLWDASQELPPATAVRGRFKQKVTLIVDYTVLHKDQVVPVAEFMTTVGANLPDICPYVSRPGEHISMDCWGSVQKLVTKSFA